MKSKKKQCKCQDQIEKDMLGVRGYPMCYVCPICNCGRHCETCKSKFLNKK